MTSGQSGFWVAGIGDAAATSTPMMTPDRSDAEDVAVTDSAPLAGMTAEVRTASQLWSVPFVAATVCSVVHPDGARDWEAAGVCSVVRPAGASAGDAAVLSPQTAAMVNALAAGAGSARVREADRAA